MFIDMVKDSTEKGVKISKIAGDDDNTGINRLRKDGNVDIVKESDKNHVQKNITKKLYSLASVHKGLSKKGNNGCDKKFQLHASAKSWKAR